MCVHLWPEFETGVWSLKQGYQQHVTSVPCFRRYAHVSPHAFRRAAVAVVIPVLKARTLRVRVVIWVREQGVFQFFYSGDSDFVARQAKRMTP